MKNLQVIKKNLLQLSGRTLGFCIDADNGVLYVVKPKLEVLKISTVEPASEPETIAHNLDLTPELESLSSNEIKLVEFIVESGSIFLALKNGQVLRIGVSSYSPPSGCFYRHHSEIASIKLSPDQDLIALADLTSSIYIIGLDGELLQRENALSQNDSLHKPVGVGWGSRETQFFGLDGRPSKEKQLKEQISLSSDELEKIDKIESSEKYQDFRSRLTKNTVVDWRGDGQYLATLTFIPEVAKHYLKVWNRNLELQYMSDQLVTIERDLLTWIPNGHFICCAQQRDKTINEVVMFEKNGLVHQRIPLPTNLKNIFVKEMLWSPSSRILAIIANQFDLESDLVHFTPILMLYTMQNFHYYLKFTTRLSQDNHYTIRWDPINHHKLHLMSDDGFYNEYVLNFGVAFSEQLSTVAVVDAHKVLVTPLQISTIPPPMAALTLEANGPIQSIALNHHKATDIFIFTSDDKLICTNSGLGKGLEAGNEFLKIHRESHLPTKKLESLIDCYEINRAIYRIEDVQTFQNIIPVESAKLIATRALNHGCEVVSITLPDSKDACIKTISKLDHQVVAAARTYATDCKDIVLVASNGSVMVLDSLIDRLEPLFQFSSNSKLNFIELQSIRSQDKTALVSLFQDMSLLFNDDVLLSTSCTSFRVTENYLIYTTTENHMHFLLLNRLWSRSIKETCCSQPIEVGATLITASETDAKVVLQMPRGNLEILHPRVLIFFTLTQLLDEKEFVQAIQMARRHRVNMNFICDYLLRKEVSMDLIDEFALVVAIHNPQLLSLFLTELDDEDTISNRYKNIMEHLPERTFVSGNPALLLSKVQRVCSAINLPEDRKFLQPKLLSLLKQTPKKTCEALCMVQKLDKQFHRGALEFMLYFIDVDQLFSDALRTYDTDIALMVASVSHKDPKEYLALLDRFNAEKKILLRNFQIDMYTKNYGDAYAKLFEYHDSQDDFQETETHARLKEIAISKRVFKRALSCFTSTTKDRKLFEELWFDYGSYLLEKRCYLEAGLAFSKALELKSDEMDYFNKALNCFSLANSSEYAFALIPKLTNQDQNIETIASRLLEEDKGPEAVVLLATTKLRLSNDGGDTLEDSNGKFMKKLLNKNHWHLAEFMFAKPNSGAIRETIANHIRDLVQSQATIWTDEVSLMKQQFERLRYLLTTYKSRAALEAANMNHNFISDSLSTVDGSEISSTVSGSDGRGPAKSGVSSIKTRNSSKSNKSQVQKKKRINLKPGGRYEDLALALDLRKFILRHRSDEDEFMSLMAGLFEYCYSTSLPEDDSARTECNRLNTLLIEQFHLRKSISSALWPDSPMNEQQHSLYRRFSNLLSEEDRNYENEEFEVLMRPPLPKEPTIFEL